MKLPNFYEFEPLNAVKAAMSIPRNVYGTLTVEVDVGRLTETELEKLASIPGLEISTNDLTVLPDNTLAYKDSRVLLYIRDVSLYGNYEAKPRIHLANCETLQKMRTKQRFDRYVVSTNTDGKFEINMIQHGTAKRVTSHLSVCQHCLALLKLNGFSKGWEKTKKIDFVESFKISFFFEKYPKSLHTKLPRYNSDNAPLNTYSDDFSEISRKIRIAVGWRCQQCGINLSSPDKRKWLHVHHINGLKHDNSRDNLKALCIRCHAEEPNHNHMKQSQDYREFLTLR